MRKTLFIIFILLSLVFSSCSKKREIIEFNDIDLLALDPTVRWAVVIEPYAAFRKEASWSSNVLDHCRLGDVLMIEGNAILDSTIKENEKEIWYRFDKGWLSSTSISVYQNKLKAEKVSATLIK